LGKKRKSQKINSRYYRGDGFLLRKVSNLTRPRGRKGIEEKVRVDRGRASPLQAVFSFKKEEKHYLCFARGLLRGGPRGRGRERGRGE